MYKEETSAPTIIEADVFVIENNTVKFYNVNVEGARPNERTNMLTTPQRFWPSNPNVKMVRFVNWALVASIVPLSIQEAVVVAE